MIYSVWNRASRGYDYYEGPGSLVDGTAKPRSMGYGHQLGITPEEAAPSLPLGTKKIGSGEFPRGTIATSGFSLGLGLDLGALPVSWLIGGAVAALWLFGGRR